MTKCAVDTTVRYYSNDDQTETKKLGCTLTHKHRLHRLLRYRDGSYRADYKAVVQAILHGAPPRQMRKHFADFMDNPQNTDYGGKVFVQRAFLKMQESQEAAEDTVIRGAAHTGMVEQCWSSADTFVSDAALVCAFVVGLFLGGAVMAVL